MQFALVEAACSRGAITTIRDENVACRDSEIYGCHVSKVSDPFAGGEVIPVEAMGLGCDVRAADSKPVAWFIQKCTLDHPHVRREEVAATGFGGNNIWLAQFLSKQLYLKQLWETSRVSLRMSHPWG